MTSRNPLLRRLLQAFVLAVPVVCFATAAFAKTATPDQSAKGSGIHNESEDAAAPGARAARACTRARLAPR